MRLSATLASALQQLPRPIKGGRVFRNAKGDPLHAQCLESAFKRAVKRAKLDGFTFHDLWHSAASFMVQAGVPLNTVREILGHKSLKMTLRYAHLAPHHQDQAMEVMDRIHTASRATEAGTGAGA